MSVSPYKLASVLLQYPTAALFDGLGVLEAEAARLPRPCAAPFGRFLGWLGETPPSEVAQHYVATFDLRRRCARSSFSPRGCSAAKSSTSGR